MIYARAHDQTVAEDYFTAMARVEQRLDIVPEHKQEIEDEVVKVQEPTKLFQLIQRLEVPELCLEERLGIASQLRDVLGAVHEHAPPKKCDKPCHSLSTATANHMPILFHVKV